MSDTNELTIHNYPWATIDARELLRRVAEAEARPVLDYNDQCDIAFGRIRRRLGERANCKSLSDLYGEDLDLTGLGLSGEQAEMAFAAANAFHDRFNRIESEVRAAWKLNVPCGRTLGHGISCCLQQPCNGCATALRLREIETFSDEPTPAPVGEKDPRLLSCVVTVDGEGLATAVYRFEGNMTDGSDTLGEDVRNWSNDDICRAVAATIGIDELRPEVAEIEVVWE